MEGMSPTLKPKSPDRSNEGSAPAACSLLELAAEMEKRVEELAEKAYYHRYEGDGKEAEQRFMARANLLQDIAICIKRASGVE